METPYIAAHGSFARVGIKMRTPQTLAAFAFAIAFVPGVVGAQTAPQPSAFPEVARLADPSRAWHFSSGLGLGSAGGGYGAFLEKPLYFELQVARQSASGAWRFGAGLKFTSMAPGPNPGIAPDVEDRWLADAEWARLETFASVTRVFNPSGRFRPYLQGRVGAVRIHPRSELFFTRAEIEDRELEPGESPTIPTNGFGFTLQPGFELSLGRGVSLDAGAFWTWYQTGDYDLGPLGLPPVSDGQEWGARLGLAWQPFVAVPAQPVREPLLVDPTTGKVLPLPPEDGDRDAWGVRRSWGWATGEMLAINFGAAMLNEYVRSANFNQISPRSFWANLQEGFTYDDNEFQTNQLIHPFNGATYFNSARANGIGFWGSSGVALIGAFLWEMAGETHPMSFNDMVSTGIGGIARGEVAYRVSSLILDNTARGGGRVGREAAALIFNPVRGFNRIVSGDASEVKGNPASPRDWRPSMLLSVRAGARVIGEGESIRENTNSYGFLEATLSHGDPWDPENRRPYDRFDATTQVNFGDKTAFGRVLIRGDLFSKLLSPNHSLALQQDFDYIDNEAFEYGGQSLGPSLLSRFELGGETQLWSRLQAYGILLGAVNSELSVLADVADQERIREYDYGPGVGTSLELYLFHKQRPLLLARYRYSYLDVSNGSLYNDESGGRSLASVHHVQQLQVKLEIPLSHRLSLGADGAVFFRRSHYDFAGSDLPPLVGEPGRRTLTQRNPEVRLFLTWQYNH